MFDTLQRRRRNRIVLRTVLAIVGTLIAGIMTWIATDFDFTVEPDDVLICNGTDCSWFPAEIVVAEEMEGFCILTEDTFHPAPYWDCPAFGGK